MRARAPYALARAVAATTVAVTGATTAHTWAGGDVPTGPGLALVAAVVLGASVLVFRRDVPGWALLPAVAAAQLGVHESFGLVASHDHAAAAAPDPGWSWQMVGGPRLRHPADRRAVVGRPARGVVRRLGPRAPGRPGPHPRAAPAVRRHHAVLARPPARLPAARSAPGGPVRLSPSGPGWSRDPRPAPHPGETCPSARSRASARFPAATAAIALSLAAPASAHVTATPSTAAAGAYTVVTFSVGHGCEGSPTTKIEIQVPESVLSVTPSRNPFYDVEKTIEKLDEPVADAHGNEVTERTASIVYTATHAAARRPARRLRAVLPAARRRGRDAEPSRRSRPARRARPAGPRSRPRARTPRSSRARHRRSRSWRPRPAATVTTRPPSRPRTTPPRRTTPTRPPRRRPTTRATPPRPSGGPASWQACSAWPPAVSPWPGPARRRDLRGATGAAAPALPPGWARVGVALVALALVVLGAAPASAHAELIDTDPAEGAVVETAPDTVTLTFNEPVRLTSQEIAVYDAAGDEVALDRRRQRHGGDRRPHRRGRPRRRHLRRVVERALRRRPPDLGRADLLGRRTLARR